MAMAVPVLSRSDGARVEVRLEAARLVAGVDDPGVRDAVVRQHARERSARVRAALNERKLVERAKGLLMATRKLSEDEAHKMLRQTAMSQNRRLVDVAETVLSMADYL